VATDLRAGGGSRSPYAWRDGGVVSPLGRRPPRQRRREVCFRSTWRDGVAARPSLRPRARLAAVRVCAGVPASRWCHSFAPRRAVASRAAAKRELQARPPCARRIWSPRAALFAFSANHTFSSLLATACQFQTPL